MTKAQTLRIYCDQTALDEIIQILDAKKISYGRPRPLGGGSEPLNAPIDTDLIKELTMTVTVGLSSTTALLLLAERLVEVSIRLKKKVAVLLDPSAKPTKLQRKEDIEKLRKQLPKPESAKKTASVKKTPLSRKK